MNEKNQLQKSPTNSINVQTNGQNGFPSLPAATPEQQLGISLEGLTEEQKQVIRGEIARRSIALKIDVIEAQNRLIINSAEMNQTIQNANELSQTKSDFSVQSEHKTATGNANIKVSSYRNTSLGIVVCILGAILILALTKGC